MMSTKVFVALGLWASITILTPATKAETWYEDFTDGVLGDDGVGGSTSGLEWQFSEEHQLIHGVGLRIFHSDLPSGRRSSAFATNIGLREGWSIRASGRLLPGTSNPPNNRLGVEISPLASANANGAFIALHQDGFADMQPGNANLFLPVVFANTNVDPFHEVVFQFDTFDEMLEAWIWTPDNPPQSGTPPLLRDDEGYFTSIFPSSWEPSAPGIYHFDSNRDSSAVWTSITISTEHIPFTPIPEPATFVLVASAIGRPWRSVGRELLRMPSPLVISPLTKVQRVHRPPARKICPLIQR